MLYKTIDITLKIVSFKKPIKNDFLMTDLGVMDGASEPGGHMPDNIQGDQNNTAMYNWSPCTSRPNGIL